MAMSQLDGTGARSGNSVSPKPRVLTLLDIELGLVDPAIRRKAQELAAPVFARVVARILREEQAKKAAAGA